jgi:hypothetical protein
MSKSKAWGIEILPNPDIEKLMNFTGKVFSESTDK